ncbi:unnamed protein product [Lepeophtheirus salmonis]|uniref:(salmon louse) hypothetical protein n=1 Tax=Lepeophtheirus salmonis TaxID=72036 RepID=A0A7R8H539_LEPSM|nr:unnamed protein product [Lepeophtheirus salmonis]CAF2874117.1 unnamed protein product [Lepeophtheirus salmonis]
MKDEVLNIEGRKRAIIIHEFLKKKQRVGYKRKALLVCVNVAWFAPEAHRDGRSCGLTQISSMKSISMRPKGF